MTSLSDFSANTLAGQELPLSTYDGKVVLVVNTASKCGLTPQFEGLEALYKEFSDEGLVILGFPCIQFAGQEPGDSEQIGDFCTRNYGVSFPMFEKIDVNGKDAHPLYKWLRKEKTGLLGGAIKWNFTKFLLARDGSVIERFAPTVEPADIAAKVKAAL